MPQYRTPGVYIEEVPSGPRPVDGAATAIAAMVGITARGPVNTPVAVRSLADFTRRFGGPLAPGLPDGIDALPHAAAGFFANGGTDLFVVRVVGPAAATSTVALTGPLPDAPLLHVRANAPGIWGDALRVRTTTAADSFDLTVERLENGLVVEGEQFAALSLGPDHPRFAPAIVGRVGDAPGGSRLIRLAVPESPPPGLPAARDWPLTGGGDDLAGITDATIIGTASDDPAARTGIQALANEPAITLVAAPGHTAPAVQQALIAHAERERFRVAILDAPAVADADAAIAHREHYDSRNAALYHPWIDIADPATGAPLRAPPSGHVMGIIARVDGQRGVWKAPANEVVVGALGLADPISHSRQELLNASHVNALRDFRAVNRGLRLYGARTLSTDSEWKYLNVRRLMLHIEQSLETGLQWAVFEPNAEPAWAAVRSATAAFLRTLWRNGALPGATEREAFHVAIGRHQTMTDADIAAGRIILQIGVAATRPAEFLTARIALQAV